MSSRAQFGFSVSNDMMDVWYLVDGYFKVLKRLTNSTDLTIERIANMSRTENSTFTLRKFISSPKKTIIERSPS